jgi:hypothetical protein
LRPRFAFCVNQLGFTSPWRYDEDGRVYVAQVDRQACALILADTGPEKIGKGLMFISLNVEPPTRVGRCECHINSEALAFAHLSAGSQAFSMGT